MDFKAMGVVHCVSQVCLLVSSAVLWHGPAQGNAGCEISCGNWIVVGTTNAGAPWSSVLLATVYDAGALLTGLQVLVLWVLGSVWFGVSAVAASWRHAVLQH